MWTGLQFLEMQNKLLPQECLFSWQYTNSKSLLNVWLSCTHLELLMKEFCVLKKKLWVLRSFFNWYTEFLEHKNYSLRYLDYIQFTSSVFSFCSHMLIISDITMINCVLWNGIKQLQSVHQCYCFDFDHSNTLSERTDKRQE